MKTAALKLYLKEGLEIVERSTAKSLALPIVSNVVLSARKERVRLSATDLQMGITYEFLGNTEEEGDVVFPGRFLSPLLAICSEEKVELASQGKTLSVNAGNHKAQLKVMDAEEFPIIPSLDGNEISFQVQTDAFCRALSQVVGMVGQSQARPEISGVLFAIEKKVCCMVATDSFRLAERKISLEKEGSLGKNFILPSKTARELISILGERSGKTTLYVSPTQAVLVYEAQEDPSRLRIQVVSRIIEGEYPHYQDVIPSSQKTLVIVPKNDLLNHVKAAGIFAGKTQEVRLRVNPVKKEVAFFSENSEAGSHQSILRGDISGEQVDVAFNWRFLVDGLLHISGQQVELRINGEDGATLVRASEPEGYLYVIMPIKA